MQRSTFHKKYPNKHKGERERERSKLNSIQALQERLQLVRESKVDRMRYNILWISEFETSSACEEFQDQISSKDDRSTQDVNYNNFINVHRVQFPNDNTPLHLSFEEWISEEDIPWITAIVVEISSEEKCLIFEKMLKHIMEWLQQQRTFNPLHLLFAQDENEPESEFLPGDHVCSIEPEEEVQGIFLKTERADSEVTCQILTTEGRTKQILPANLRKMAQSYYCCEASSFVNLYVYTREERFTVLEANQNENEDIPLFHSLQPGQRVLLNLSKMNRIIKPNEICSYFCRNKEELHKKIKKNLILWSKKRWFAHQTETYTLYPVFIAKEIEEAYRKGDYLFSLRWQYNEEEGLTSKRKKFKHHLKHEHPHDKDKMNACDKRNTCYNHHFDSDLKISLLDKDDVGNFDEVVPTHCEVKRFPPALTVDIPPHLQEEIKCGNCVLFLGAGFVKPGGSPSWGELLREVSHKGTQFMKLLLNELDRIPKLLDFLLHYKEVLNFFGEDDSVDCSQKCDKEKDIDQRLPYLCAKWVGELVSSKQLEIEAVEVIEADENSRNNSFSAEGKERSFKTAADLDNARVRKRLTLEDINTLLETHQRKIKQYRDKGLIGEYEERKRTENENLKDKNKDKKRRQQGERYREAAKKLVNGELEDLHKQIKHLTRSSAPHDDYEKAAQQLEDYFSAEILNLLVCKRLLRLQYDHLREDRKKYSVMLQRLEWIRNVPFSAIVTTNYDLLSLVCAMASEDDFDLGHHNETSSVFTPLSKHGQRPPYWDILRSRPDPHNHGLFLAKKPFVQIHGTVEEPEAIVLSREGYRRLLNSHPGYAHFLRSLMATKTILYIGFSFTDDYLNEMRSSIMSMVHYDHTTKPQPLAYAIVNDKSEADCEYFLQHEGVQFISWNTADHGFGGCERIISAICRSTSPAYTLEDPLKDTSVLFCDVGVGKKFSLKSSFHEHSYTKEKKNHILSLLHRVHHLQYVHAGDKPLNIIEVESENLDEHKLTEFFESESTNLICVYPIIFPPHPDSSHQAIEQVLNFIHEMKDLKTRNKYNKRFHLILLDPLEIIQEEHWPKVQSGGSSYGFVTSKRWRRHSDNGDNWPSRPPLSSIEETLGSKPNSLPSPFGASEKAFGSSKITHDLNDDTHLTVIQCTQRSEVIIAMLDYNARSSIKAWKKIQKSAKAVKGFARPAEQIKAMSLHTGTQKKEPKLKKKSPRPLPKRSKALSPCKTM